MLHHKFDRLMTAETEELARLTANHDRLESEQDHIDTELDQVTRRIDAHFGDYADARAHLDEALGLLINCAVIFALSDNANRRLCNQAFFMNV